MEPSFFGHLQRSVGGHTVSNRALERGRLGIDAHLDFGELPAIRWVDVIRARGGGADEVGERAHQHVVAGTRPGFVEPDLVLVIDVGVVEEVDGRPAAAAVDAVRRHRDVEVIGAVGVPEVACVFIGARGAGQSKRVVAADRVLHDFNERVAIAVVES